MNEKTLEKSAQYLSEALKAKDFETIRKLYEENPSILFEKVVTIPSQAKKLDYDQAAEIFFENDEKSNNDLITYKRIIVFESMKEALNKPSFSAKKSLANFEFQNLKTEGSKPGLQITKNDKVKGKFQEYILKAQSDSESIAEVIGSALFRFFLNDNLASKNKLVFNQNNNHVYVTSKILKDFESIDNIEYNMERNNKNEFDINFLQKPEYDLNKILAISLLLQHHDTHTGNIGISASENKLAILDYDTILLPRTKLLEFFKFHEDFDEYAQNFLDTFFYGGINPQPHLIKGDELRKTFSSMKEVSNFVQNNQNQIKQIITKALTHVEKFLPKLALQEFFQQRFEKDYDNILQGTDEILKQINNNSQKMELYAEFLELQESVFNKDFVKVSDLIIKNQNLLSEKFVWFEESFENKIDHSITHHCHSFSSSGLLPQTFEEYYKEHFSEDPYSLNQINSIVGEVNLT